MVRDPTAFLLDRCRSGCSLLSLASSLPLGVTASQFQRIVPADYQSNDQFGWAVDIDLPYIVPSRVLPPPM